MNPPIFCGLTGWIYCVLTRSRFILDSHTGAFIESKWRVFSFIHAFLARKALVNVVTNEYLCEYIKRWGGEHFVIPDPPIQFGALTKKSLNKPHVIIINTFSFDEPVKEILIAASKMPDVNFSMTGNLKYCKKEYLKLKPINFEFTGFMEKDDYISIIYSSDAALVLTKEDFTMQSGANEAMSIGIPIITSDWPVLRSIFYKGTVFVDNSVDGIMAGVKTALSNTMKLKQEINELRHERTILSQQIENLFRNEFLKGGQYTS
jgi:glycosyltransferase involved in cell wall biosynthesis